MKKLVVVVALLLIANAYAGTNVPFEASIDTQAIPSFCGPTCLQLEITGVGQARQFGHLTLTGLSTVDLATGHQTGTSTLTAADGSTLTLSFEGTDIPTGPQDFAFFGEWTADSGTGRFQGVQGGGTYDGTASGIPGNLHLEGALNNPGKR